MNSVLFGGIILWCIFKDGIVLSIFSNAFLRNIGKYSYGMYLFQYPARYTTDKILEIIHLYPNSINKIVYGLLIFTTCYLIARISWLIYEGPINSLKNKLLQSQLNFFFSNHFAQKSNADINGRCSYSCKILI